MYFICRSLTVTGFWIDNNGQEDGLTLDSSARNVFSDGFIRTYGDDGYNTKAAIRLLNNYPSGWNETKHNEFSNIIIARQYDTESNQWAYGVHADSTADYNIFGDINAFDVATNGFYFDGGIDNNKVHDSWNMTSWIS